MSSLHTGEGAAGKLRPGFSPLGIWAFSIGTSIGWGSFIVTCNTYLQKSGLFGTVFGLLVGMAVILVITWNLQYMIRSAPDAGGLIGLLCARSLRLPHGIRIAVTGGAWWSGSCCWCWCCSPP